MLPPIRNIFWKLLFNAFQWSWRAFCLLLKSLMYNLYFYKKKSFDSPFLIFLPITLLCYKCVSKNSLQNRIFQKSSPTSKKGLNSTKVEKLTRNWAVTNNKLLQLYQLKKKRKKERGITLSIHTFIKIV